MSDDLITRISKNSEYGSITVSHGNGWQLSLVYHSTRSAQRDVLYVVNAEKMRSYRIGFTLGL
ncbi:hypothetical protein HMSP1_6 [Sinorhizobium phage HMSP1-Susan]|nr:hypothetical protein HMSP1_6 [Sinorhizobium phage HMSP1-Susan]